MVRLKSPAVSAVSTAKAEIGALRSKVSGSQKVVFTTVGPVPRFVAKK